MNKSLEFSENEIEERSIFQSKSNCTTKLVKKKESNPFTNMLNSFKISPKLTPKNIFNNSKNEIYSQRRNLIYSPSVTRHRTNLISSRFTSPNFIKRERSPIKTPNHSGLLKLVNEKYHILKHFETTSFVSEEIIQPKVKIIYSKNKVFFNPIANDNNYNNGNNIQMKEIKDEQFCDKGKRASFYLRKINIFGKQFVSKPHKIKNIIKPKKKIKKHTKNNIQKKERKRKKKYISCKCKSTNCLKLYCECFKNYGKCNHTCHCLDCKNNSNFETERNEVLLQLEIKKKNNIAKPPKKEVINDTIGKTNFSCNCVKSKCLKKYCDCFNNNNSCGPNCRCTNCSNKK